MLLKWGYNHALVHEVWTQWAFLLLKCRYGAKNLSEGGTFLGSGLLKAERKHRKNILRWKSALLLRLTYTTIVLSVFCSN